MTPYKIPRHKPVRLPGLGSALTAIGQENVYVRRKLASPLSAIDAQRLFFLSAGRDVSEAMGYLWQMEQTMAKMLPLVTHMREAIHRTMEQTSVAARAFEEPAHDE